MSDNIEQEYTKDLTNLINRNQMDYVNKMMDFIRNNPSFTAPKGESVPQRNNVVAPPPSEKAPVLPYKAPSTASVPTNIAPDYTTAGQPSADISKPEQSFDDAWKNAPNEYKNVIKQNMQRAWRDYYGWQNNPAVKFPDFWKDYFAQTEGFDPRWSAGILYYKNVPAQESYLKNVNLMQDLASINFDKAMSYRYAGMNNKDPLLRARSIIGNMIIDRSGNTDFGSKVVGGALSELAPGVQPNTAVVDRDNRTHYMNLVNAVVKATGGKANQVAVENWLFDIKRPGQTPSKMKAEFFNGLQNKFHIDLQALHKLGLNDQYFQNQVYTAEQEEK